MSSCGRFWIPSGHSSWQWLSSYLHTWLRAYGISLEHWTSRTISGWWILAGLTLSIRLASVLTAVVLELHLLRLSQPLRIALKVAMYLTPVATSQVFIGR